MYMLEYTIFQVIKRQERIIELKNYYLLMAPYLNVLYRYKMSKKLTFSSEADVWKK